MELTSKNSPCASSRHDDLRSLWLYLLTTQQFTINRHCIVTGQMPSYAYKHLNSLHKLENKFCMRAGDQKLRYDLEWPYSVFFVVGSTLAQAMPFGATQSFDKSDKNE